MGQALGRIEVETPAYSVVKDFGSYQIRRYETELVLAQVSSIDFPDTETNTPVFSNSAFRVLAEYIGVFKTPANERTGEPTPIAMTAPVISQRSPEPVAMTAPVMSTEKAGVESMAFILPKQYTLSTSPKPTDPRVKLVACSAQTVAVYTFTWFCDMKRGAAEAENFLAQLEEDNLTIAGRWCLARYNPPWTLPFLRTNEIHVPVSFEP
eukprot:m.375810 g.375810  ORF g.375810 m.375810 type:complete len:209 (-) comp16700_c0_seq13:4222-4848(-)